VRLPTSPSGRGLIVAGAGIDEPGAVLEAAVRLGWPVVADPRSGCRVPAGPVIAAADALLRAPGTARWTPDLVVRIGGPWASKVLGQWLAGLDPAVPQVLADPWGRWADPERRASHVVAADPDLVIAAVGAGAPVDPTWLPGWQVAEAAAQAALEDALAPGGRFPLSEPAVARAVVAGLPDHADLVVSSSMPVRDVEWYGAPRSGIRVLANRGANGIDGVVSTALGAALGTGRPTLALVGDLAFLYDAGALLWANGRDVSLTVLVVDNGGGGIFSFLPQAAALAPDRFERYWATPHGVDVGAVAAAYRVDVTGVADRPALDSLVADVDRPGVRVAVVGSDRAANVDVHDELHRAVGRAVVAALASAGVRG
jgi:2-succinyl-5-enolpyruvyl-6-hydroxy-3-cyclohexene-1-carboxylate synthase